MLFALEMIFNTKKCDLLSVLKVKAKYHFLCLNSPFWVLKFTIFRIKNNELIHVFFYDSWFMFLFFYRRNDKLSLKFKDTSGERST